MPEGELPLIDPVASGLLPPEPAQNFHDAQAGTSLPSATSALAGLTWRTRRFLKLGALNGHRNHELFCAACDMASKGIGRSEAQTPLLEACRRCEPPYPATEALQSIDSAYSKPRRRLAKTAEDRWGAYTIPRCIAQRGDLTGADKLVWAELDYRQRDKGYCYPSLATIAADTGFNRDTVTNAVKRLEAKGLLTVERSFGHVNRYTTHLTENPTPS